MSEQQFQREHLDQDTPQHEDPLAELARIVAGEEVVAPAAIIEEPAPSVVTDVSTEAVVQSAPVAPIETVVQPTLAEPQPVAAPTESNIGGIASSSFQTENLDLESQLLAELGGAETVIEPTPRSMNLEVPQEATQPAKIAEEVLPQATDMAAEIVEQVAPTPPPVEEDFELALAQQLTQVGSPVAAASQVAPQTQPEMFVAEAPVEMPMEPLAQPAHVPIETAMPAIADVVDNYEQTGSNVDEMDFSAAFEEEFNQAEEIAILLPIVPESPSVVQHSQLNVSQSNYEVEPHQQAFPIEQNLPLEPILNENINLTPVEAVQPATETDHFQFQAAPDFQQHDQQINQSVQAIQDDFVDDLDIEDAFSDAFAEELSTQTVGGNVEPVAASAHAAVSAPVPEFLTHTAGVVSSAPVETVGYAEAEVQELPLQIAEPEIVEDQPSVIIAPSRNRGKRMAAMALGLAVLAGSGVVAYSYMSGNTTTDEPIVVRADSSDFKVKPEKPGGKEIANQDQPVYDAVAGTNSDENAQETLVLTSEEPVDVTRNVEPVRPAKSNVRLATGNNSDSTENVVAVMQPRKVKTVAVRADGSLVTALTDPIENLPSSVRTALDSQSADAPKPDDTSIDGASSTGNIAVPSANPNLPAGTVETVVVKPVVVKPIIVKTRALAVPNAVKPAEIAKPVPVSATIATPQPIGDGYVVQVSSQRSFDAAEATYQNLKRRFAGLLSDQTKEIREAKVEGKGTFFRVRILQNSKAEALDFCTRYKTAGGSCFVTK